jgi:glycosyltransferase involved in cell wall biosynthesis
LEKQYKITIITVTLNAANTLHETIESVISQEYNGDLEYIIIDGGSTDGTVDIIKSYDSRITFWVSEPDYGLYHAMNKGIERATGDIVGIINGDDYYYPGVMQKVVDAYQEKSLDKYILWGDIMHGNDLSKGWREWNLTRGVFAPHPSMFCPKLIYDRIGTYRLTYRLLADYEFMYRAVHKHGIEPIYLAELLAFFRPGGMASQHVFRSLTEEMLVKIDCGQSIKQAFVIYLLKLLKNIGKLT